MTPYYARATAAVGVDLAGGPCGGWTVEEIVAASDALSAKTAAREHLEARVDPKAISIRQPGAGRHYFLTCVTVLRRSRSAIQVSLGTCRLSFRNDPRQYCLHRRDAWIIRLSDDRKQLKPQIQPTTQGCHPPRPTHASVIAVVLWQINLLRAGRQVAGEKSNQVTLVQV